jgi:hypothetical protein
MAARSVLHPMNANARAAALRLLIFLIVILIAAACVQAAQSPVPTAPPTAPVPGESDKPSGPPTASASIPPSASADAIGELQCEGGATAGTNDYAEGPSGGLATVEAATRALPGVIATDEIVVAGERSAVRRDGRTVFTGEWLQSSTGGWLLGSFAICGGSGISTATD